MRWRQGRKGRTSGEVDARDRHRVDLEAPQSHRASREKQRRKQLGWRSKGREGLEQVQPASSLHLPRLLISKPDSWNPWCNCVLPQDWSPLHSAGRGYSRLAEVGMVTGAGCSAGPLVPRSQALPRRCRAAQREGVFQSAGETGEAADPQQPFPVPAGSQGLPGQAEEQVS